METLPAEILNLIFSSLDDIKDVRHISLTCKYCNILISEDAGLWQHLYFKYFPELSFTPEEKNSYFSLVDAKTPPKFFSYIYQYTYTYCKPLKIDHPEFGCRNLIIVPYFLVAKLFSLPIITKPDILTYLRYDGLSGSGHRTILKVLRSLKQKFDANPHFTELRLTFLGISMGPHQLKPGKFIYNISHSFPTDIIPLSITETEYSCMKIFTIQKTLTNQGLYYSSLNNYPDLISKLFRQLVSHYEEIFALDAKAPSGTSLRS